MKRTLSLVLLFARPLHVWNIFFSGLAILCIYNGGMLGITPSILIKLAGYAGVVAYQNFMDSPAYNYFRNAGLQVRKLYLRVFTVDLLLYLIIVVLVLIFTHVKGR